MPLRRAKPLLLLAFLALEGRQPRQDLAQIFFGDTGDSRDGLSSAVGWLRRANPALVRATGDHLETQVTTDLHELREAFGDGRFDWVDDLYGGAFAAGLSLTLGEELEEWMFRQREAAALLVREARLRQAVSLAAAGEFRQAAALTVRARGMAEAPPLSPVELPRVFVLLQAADHPLAGAVEAEAREFGVTLDLVPAAARAQLRHRLLGREREREVLRALAPGQWCWVRGGAGMGKSALLAEVGAVLPGRSHLPLATLAPLLGERTAGHPAAQVRHLAALEQPLLIDDWEAVDDASRETLARLRASHAPVRVVIAGRGPPEVEVDRVLELEPLSREDLEALPGALEATGGLPALVAAFARGERLAPTLEGQLAALGGPARQVFKALALLPTPDLPLVGRALDLDGTVLASAFRELFDAGLVDAGGDVRARTAAHELLDRRPAGAAELALRLARHLGGEAALLLYERGRAFWSAEDLPGVRAASTRWARSLLDQGRPEAAVHVLRQVSLDDAGHLLLVEALEGVGAFERAWQVLEGLEDTATTLAWKATMLRRRGQPEEASAAARRALDGPPLARARALHVLAKLDVEAGNLGAGARQLRASAGLYLMTGRDTERGEVLNELARVRAERGEDAEPAFLEALAASRDPLLHTRVLVNLGKVYEGRGDTAAAERAYREALGKTERTGALDSASRVWNNLGVLYHNAGRAADADDAYRQALQAARATGELLVQATVLGNLAELHGDAEALREAVRVLEQAGHMALAAQFRGQLQGLVSPPEYDGLHGIN